MLRSNAHRSQAFTTVISRRVPSTYGVLSVQSLLYPCHRFFFFVLSWAFLWLTPLESEPIDELRTAREKAETSMKAGDMQGALRWYEIWLQAVPADTTGHVRYAIALAKTRRLDKAMEVLTTAAQRGLRDAASIEAEPSFAGLKGMKGWTELLESMKRNTIGSEYPMFFAVQKRVGRFKVYAMTSEGEYSGQRGDTLTKFHPVVLLHGNGQTPELMLRWARSLRLPGVMFICPEAPYVKVRESLYDQTLKLSAAPDDIQTPGEMRSEVMEYSAEWYFNAYEQAKIVLPLIDEKPVVMGFSQGGFYASLLAMLHPEKISSLVMLCASYYPEARMEQRAEGLRRHRVSIFHCHGRNDAIVPFSTAEHIESMLHAADVQHTFVAFDGEHWMSAEVDESVRAWLRERFALTKQ